MDNNAAKDLSVISPGNPVHPTSCFVRNTVSSSVFFYTTLNMDN